MGIMLGCSGWDYSDWVGPFYKTAKESKLRAYSEIFKTVEINSTFYSYPNPGLVMGWQRFTPEDFIFTAKVPKVITHEKFLDTKKGVEDDLLRFCQLMSPLQEAGKLGCLLIQLPPGLNFDLGITEKFFQVLPEEFRFAIEFRNKTWLCNNAFNLLEKYNVAYTIVDEPLLPPEARVTADFAYIRWHGQGKRPWYYYRYSKEELEPWAERVREVSEKTKKVYGYFNNHYHGYAPENCIDVLEMLGISTKEQRIVKNEILEYREKGRLEKRIKDTSLTDFFQVTGPSIKDLLKDFMDEGRLERAREIKDSEIKIEEISERALVGKVKDYFILMDLVGRKIHHNCGDWKRCSPRRTLCKHMGKFILSLPEKEARWLLKDLEKGMEGWELKAF